MNDASLIECGGGCGLGHGDGQSQMKVFVVDVGVRERAPPDLMNLC